MRADVEKLVINEMGPYELLITLLKINEFYPILVDKIQSTLLTTVCERVDVH